MDTCFRLLSLMYLCSTVFKLPEFLTCQDWQYRNSLVKFNLWSFESEAEIDRARHTLLQKLIPQVYEKVLPI